MYSIVYINEFDILDRKTKKKDDLHIQSETF